MKTTGATSAAGTTCPSGVPVFSLEFKWDRAAQYLIFWVVLCGPLFVFFVCFHLFIILFIFPFMSSDYPFGIISFLTFPILSNWSIDTKTLPST